MINKKKLFAAAMKHDPCDFGIGAAQKFFKGKRITKKTIVEYRTKRPMDIGWLIGLTKGCGLGCCKADVGPRSIIAKAVRLAQ